MDARLPWSALPTWSLFLPRAHHVTTSSLAPGALVFRLYFGTLQPIQAGPCSRTAHCLHSLARRIHRLALDTPSKSAC